MTHDMIFTGHRKIDLVVGFTKFRNGFLIARFLVSEVITGHTDHDQATLLVVHPDALQLCVLGAYTALRGRIDKKNRLAAIIR